MKIIDNSRFLTCLLEELFPHFCCGLAIILVCYLSGRLGCHDCFWLCGRGWCLPRAVLLLGIRGTIHQLLRGLRLILVFDLALWFWHLSFVIIIIGQLLRSRLSVCIWLHLGLFVVHCLSLDSLELYRMY